MDLSRVKAAIKLLEADRIARVFNPTEHQAGGGRFNERNTFLKFSGGKDMDFIERGREPMALPHFGLSPTHCALYHTNTLTEPKMEISKSPSGKRTRLKPINQTCSGPIERNTQVPKKHHHYAPSGRDGMRGTVIHDERLGGSSIVGLTG
ncbi:hypothetical protein EYF80_022802 [Liparis tanakae]|uniref:Uncharacterized protein n=1 Tax=Liparis tanakae TaxID=230148 RepID=A0A4Z2HMC0_9TELE|nr:hypothetical protein EYF80_022802 [Liparis tanakae]